MVFNGVHLVETKAAAWPPFMCYYYFFPTGLPPSHSSTLQGTCTFILFLEAYVSQYASLDTLQGYHLKESMTGKDKGAMKKVNITYFLL